MTLTFRLYISTSKMIMRHGKDIICNRKGGSASQKDIL
jgi:hypothetical protein